MKNDKDNTLGSMSDSIHRMVDILDKMDLTSEEIAERIGDFCKMVRLEMRITAMLSGNRELADKIDAANNLITQKRIDAFKQSVADGTYLEFLSKMSWKDKDDLSDDMELFRTGEKPLTEEEQLYYRIIEKSMDKDIEKGVALRDGFDSVEAWQEHNANKSRKKESSFQLLLAQPRDLI